LEKGTMSEWILMDELIYWIIGYDLAHAIERERERERDLGICNINPLPLNWYAWFDKC